MKEFYYIYHQITKKMNFLQKIIQSGMLQIQLQ